MPVEETCTVLASPTFYADVPDSPIGDPFNDNRRGLISDLTPVCRPTVESPVCGKLHGGFFFASGCCTNPNFPKAWRREFSRLFLNEKVKVIPYDHLIYRSFYTIPRIKSLHENRDIQLEGLFVQGRLVAVLCEEGLCCSFSMSNRCNAGKGVPPEDGQKLALNIAVYALTH